jgi:hypothetical protein
MDEFDRRTVANMDAALENICRALPNNGGDHETRKHVAQKLVQAAREGNTSLAAFEDVARSALRDLKPSRVA